MWFRIGINIGDVMVKDGDIFGDGVNIAARLEGLAEPGGICISRGVHDHVRRRLPYGFEDLGEQSVKNIAQPIRVFRLIPDVTIQSTSGLEAPSFSELPPEPTEGEPQSVELLFWESIKDSTRVADYEAYLRQYPEGSFVALARTRLGEFASAEAGMRDPKDREAELSFWESVWRATTRHRCKPIWRNTPTANSNRSPRSASASSACRPYPHRTVSPIPCSGYAERWGPQSTMIANPSPGPRNQTRADQASQWSI